MNGDNENGGSVLDASFIYESMGLNNILYYISIRAGGIDVRLLVDLSDDVIPIMLYAAAKVVPFSEPIPPETIY